MSRRVGLAGAVAIAAVLLLHGPGAGQEVSLARVDSLVMLGRAEEARTALRGWLESRQPSASRTELQRALWLRGILTVDPDQAMLDFQRLAVEFPGGEWTDEALLRLARYAEARGEADEAARHHRAILRHHPGTAAAAAAREWLETSPGTDGESGPRARPAGRANRGETASANAVGPTGVWAVQLGAFSSLERARQLVERARSEGFEPRLVAVAASPLVRVRIGRFGDAASARSLADRAAARGFDLIVVSDAANERPVGG